MAFSNIVKSVENILTTIPYSTTTTSSGLTKNQDPANCIPFTSYSFVTQGTPTATYNDLLTDVYFTGTSGSAYVNFQRTTGDANIYVDISCYIVEFDPAYVTTQSGIFSMPAGSGTIYTTISSVDPSKTFIYTAYRETYGGSGLDTVFVRSTLYSATQIQHYRVIGAGSQTVNGHYYLASCIGDEFSVQHLSGSSTTSTIDALCGFSVGFTSVPIYTTNSFLLASCCVSSSNDDVSNHGLQVYDRGFGQGAYIRNSFASGLTVFYGLCVVDIKDKSKIYSQTYTPSFSDGSETVSTYDFSENTIFFNVGAYATKLAGTAANYVMGLFPKLTHDAVNNTLTFNVYNTAATNYCSAYAVDFNGVQIPSYTPDEFPVTTNNFIKSIQSFSFSLTTSLYSYSVALTKNQVPSNVLPLFSFKHKSVGTASYEGVVSTWSLVPFYDLDHSFNFYRWEIFGHSLDVEGYFIEFEENQIKVQSGHTFMPDGQTQLTIDIEPVDTSKTFVILYYNTYSAASPAVNLHLFLCRYGFTTSSGVIVERASGGTRLAISYYVIEDLGNNFYVQHSDSDLTIGTSAVDSFQRVSSRADATKSIVLASTYCDSGTDDPEEHFASVYYGVDRTVVVERNSAAGTMHWGYQMVTFYDDSLFVQHYYNDIGATTTTDSFLIDTVDLDRTIIMGPISLGTSKTGAATADSYSRSASVLRSLPSSISGTHTRYAPSSVTTSPNSYIIQFPKKPTHYLSGTVKEGSNFIDRYVSAYRSDTGEFIGRTLSSGVKGYYIETTYSGQHYVVCQDDAAGIDYNDLISGKVYPELITPTTWSGYYG